MFFDATFLPLVEGVAPHCPNVKGWCMMTDRAHMPAEAKVPLLCYEDLIDAQDGDYPWPEFDENLASSLCYTSGTTGNPKGALYCAPVDGAALLRVGAAAMRSAAPRAT